MHKHIGLFVRPDELTHEAFVEALQHNYGALVSDLDGVVRYQEVLPTAPDNAEFDALAECYFETRDDLDDIVGDSGAEQRGLPVGTDSLPAAERRHFVGDVTVQKDVVEDADGLYKHSAFLVRKSGMTHEDFVGHWQTTHTPIAREIEGVVRYETVVPTDPETMTFDGVAELYFETLDDLHAALGSEGSRDYDPTREMAQKAREDVDNFLAIDERPRLIGRNYVVRDET